MTMSEHPVPGLNKVANTFACACGGLMDVKVTPDRMEDVAAAWDIAHSDEKCRPCSREEAIAAMDPDERPTAEN